MSQIIINKTMGLSEVIFRVINSSTGRSSQIRLDTLKLRITSTVTYHNMIIAGIIRP